jgi:hypothetical protein
VELGPTLEPDVLQQHKKAVVWLLQQALTQGAGVSARLIAFPLVPVSCAKELVSAGVRISYAQLLAAANSMVAGVEVWVQAQEQCRVKTDIPALAASICVWML